MGTEERTIFIAFGIVAIFLAVIILFFLYNLYYQQKKYRQLQREKVNAEINATELESNSIATELHNDIGPFLSSIKMRLDVMETNKRAELEECMTALDTCISQVRGMAKALAPLNIYQQSFQNALRQYIHTLNFKKTIHITFTERDSVQLTADQHNQVYRILQEIINNTIKHSQATQLLIEVSKDRSELLIRTADDGIGYNMEKLRAGNKLGLGLLGIQSRIEYLNGTISLSEQQIKGTKYNIRIPLTNEP